MKKIIVILLILGFTSTASAFSLSDFFSWYGQDKQTFGALSDPFISIQLAPSPSNGDCLTTDGTDNIWDTCAAGGGGGGGGTWSTTTSEVTGVLFNYPNNDDDVVLIGDDASTTAEYFFNPNLPTFPIHYKLLGNFLGNNSSTTIINLVTTNATSTNATTTNLNVSGTLDADGLTSALTLTGSTGIFAEYTGTTCTNQFVRILSALGVATCESVGNEDFEDDDWGEISVASNVVTVDDNVIESEHLGDDDWGDITIASNVASVEDDSHAHTSTSISGIDISADTNLTAGDNLTLTDDDLDLDTTITGLTKITFQYSSSTDYSSFVTASTTNLILGGVSGNSWDDFCVTITGSSELCDGDDATGAGGGDFAWTPETNYNEAVNSTSTAIWFKDSPYSLMASSTAIIDTLLVSTTTATSTILGALQFGSTAGDNMISVTATRDYPSSNSTGGLLNIDNTLNAAAAITLYDNHGSGKTAPLLQTRVDNAAFDFPGWRLDYDGANDGLTIVATGAASNAASLSNTGLDHTLNSAYTGTTVNKGAGNFTSTNDLGTVLHVSGDPDGLAVLKTTHDGVGDADSSIFSGAASDTGYLGQGIFLDMETAGEQKILNLRADGDENFNHYSSGRTTIGTSTPSSLTILTVAATSTDTTQLLSFLNDTRTEVASLTDEGLFTLANGLTLSAGNFTIDSQAFDSLTDDATLANNSGDLQVVDVTCTDCLNATEIEDIYLLDDGDTATGDYTFDSSTFVIDSTGDEVSVGTTTQAYPLSVYAASEPQFSLSNGAGVPEWIQRNAGGNLYFATSTGAATTSSNSITFSPATSGSSGLLIGTSTPGSTGLAVVGTVFMHSLTTESGAGNVLCVKTNGEIVQDDSPLTACSGASSRTVKNSITSLTDNLAKILKLKPVSYVYNKDYSQDQTVHLGFIAEEVELVEPHLVDQGEVKGLKYAEFVTPIVGAIQEVWGEVVNLIDWNRDQEVRIKALEDENQELKARLDAIEAKI